MLSDALTVGRSSDQICVVPVPLPPYALAAPAFPFRHLASLAGRAPIGGAREVALACFVAARLSAGCTADQDELNAPARAARCAGAKGWAGTLALPPTVRGPLQRCMEASVDGTPRAVGSELSALIGAAASYLDPLSRAELQTLAEALAR
jgi:hypothetical protein